MAQWRARPWQTFKKPRPEALSGALAGGRPGASRTSVCSGGCRPCRWGSVSPARRRRNSPRFWMWPEPETAPPTQVNRPWLSSVPVRIQFFARSVPLFPTGFRMSCPGSRLKSGVSSPLLFWPSAKRQPAVERLLRQIRDGTMHNAKLLEMNRWLSALAAEVIFTHVPGSAGARGWERRVDELHPYRAAPRIATIFTESWSTIEPFIDTLPEPQQGVLRLHLVEGASYREVAERLAIPLGTVHSRVARAKRRISAAASQRTTPSSSIPSAVRRPPPGVSPQSTGRPLVAPGVPVPSPPRMRPRTAAAAGGGVDLSNSSGPEAR